MTYLLCSELSKNVQGSHHECEKYFITITKDTSFSSKQSASCCTASSWRYIPYPQHQYGEYSVVVFVAKCRVLCFSCRCHDTLLQVVHFDLISYSKSFISFLFLTPWRTFRSNFLFQVVHFNLISYSKSFISFSFLLHDVNFDLISYSKSYISI